MTTRILVVDDSEIECLLDKGLLARNPDFEVEVAGDGRQALQMLEERPPDLVVTDLVMPDIGGLELVRSIRQRHPQIPTVLMTDYGDESIAIDALEAGAASYVPKARRAERLLETVERVVDHAASERHTQRLNRRILDFHCRYCLENDRRLIGALVAQTQQLMADLQFGDLVERIRTCEALEEALLNAMCHGNLELTRADLDRAQAEGRTLGAVIRERLREDRLAERRISVVIHLTRSEARFVVRDEGPGFLAEMRSAADEDRQALARNTALANESELFDRGVRRGLTLIESLMDKVSFNDTGNEITLRKFASA